MQEPTFKLKLVCHTWELSLQIRAFLWIVDLNNEGKKLCDEPLKLFLKVGVRKQRKGPVVTASVKNRSLELKSEKALHPCPEEKVLGLGKSRLVVHTWYTVLQAGWRQPGQHISRTGKAAVFPGLARLLLWDPAAALNAKHLALLTLLSSEPPHCCSSWC